MKYGLPFLFLGVAMGYAAWWYDGRFGMVGFFELDGWGKLMVIGAALFIVMSPFCGYMLKKIFRNGGKSEPKRMGRI